MQPRTDCDFKLFLHLTHRIWHHTNYFVNLISNTDIEHPIIFTITNPNASQKYSACIFQYFPYEDLSRPEI